MNHRKFFILFLFSVLSSFNAFSQDWKLKKDSDGIKVYTRDVKGSSIQEFRGEVVAKSNLSTILYVIDNIADYPKWMYKCSYAERLKKINEASGYAYSVLDQSWPVTDRDACTFYYVTQDSNSLVVTINIKGVCNYIPEKPDRVRMPSIKGSWQLIPVSKGVTKIVYQIHSEAGGEVPAALVNMFVTNTPYYNLLNLKKIVESPLYPKKVMEHVKEL
ncbi:MAG TPA: START domain-containing protein [Bacteroidales bacterium]|nr:START domain-containing protein [Bacteroidales bacterium]